MNVYFILPTSSTDRFGFLHRIILLESPHHISIREETIHEEQSYMYVRRDRSHFVRFTACPLCMERSSRHNKICHFDLLFLKLTLATDLYSAELFPILRSLCLVLFV